MAATIALEPAAPSQQTASAAPARRWTLRELEKASELHCLACSRILALAIREDDRLRLVRAPGQQKVELTQTERGLRCARCGGFPHLQLV
jgi:DNA-directed RNA polymerase subunit RPC12/RpoP